MKEENHIFINILVYVIQISKQMIFLNWVIKCEYVSIIRYTGNKESSLYSISNYQCGSRKKELKNDKNVKNIKILNNKKWQAA